MSTKCLTCGTMFVCKCMSKLHDTDINVEVGTTVRTVGPISFVRTQGTQELPTYDILSKNDDGDECGYVEAIKLPHIRYVAFLGEAAAYDGEELLTIGRFVSDLNDYYGYAALSEKGGDK